MLFTIGRMMQSQGGCGAAGKILRLILFTTEIKESAENDCKCQ